MKQQTALEAQIDELKAMLKSDKLKDQDIEATLADK